MSAKHCLCGAALILVQYGIKKTYTQFEPFLKIYSNSINGIMLINFNKKISRRTVRKMLPINFNKKISRRIVRKMLPHDDIENFVQVIMRIGGI